MTPDAALAEAVGLLVRIDNAWASDEDAYLPGVRAGEISAFLATPAAERGRALWEVVEAERKHQQLNGEWRDHLKTCAGSCRYYGATLAKCCTAGSRILIAISDAVVVIEDRFAALSGRRP